MQNSIIFQKQTSCRGDLLTSPTPSKPWKNLPPPLQLHPLSSLPSIFSIDNDKAEHAMHYILSTCDSGNTYWINMESIMQDIQNENVLWKHTHPNQKVLTTQSNNTTPPVSSYMKTQSSLRTNYSHTVQRKQYKPHLKKPNWCNNCWFLSCIGTNKCGVQIRMGRAKDSHFKCTTSRDISVNGSKHICTHKTSQHTI